MGIVLRDTTPTDRVNAGPSFYTEPKTEKGSFWDSAAASYVNENSIGSWVADMEYDEIAAAVEGYDQYQDIPIDLSDMPLSTWRGVTSPENMQSRISEIYAEQKRINVINQNGWGAFVGGMAGILTSPEIIPDLFVGRGSTTLRGAAKLAASTLIAEGTHEYIQHQQNFTRSAQETYVNMGLAAFGGAAVGALISRKASTDTLNFMRADLEDSATPDAYVGDSVGAAKTDFANLSERALQDDFQGEAFMNKPILNWRWLGPVRPVVTAAKEIPVLGKILNDVAEHSFTPIKTKDGIGKQFAAESEVNKEIGTRMRTVHNTLNNNYKGWLKATGANRVKNFRKNWSTFNKQVHMALVSGDKLLTITPNDSVADAAIKKTAAAFRSQFNEMLETAKKYDPDGNWIDVDQALVRYADSYAPRRYNRRLIQKKPNTFKRLLQESFLDERQRIAFEEAQTAAKEAGEEFTQTIDEFAITDLDTIAEINKQVDASYDRIAYGYDEDVYMPIGASGKPFKDRKVPINDKKLIEGGWLDSDLEAMMRSYSNRVLKPARLIQRGYDPEMKEAIKAVNRAYDAKAADLDDVGANKLKKEQVKVREALETIRDRYYGRTTISTSKTDEAINDVMRSIRNINVARMMGMVLPVSMGDIFRANLTTIYAPELGKAAPTFIDALKTAKASKKLMQAFGVAHETAMMVRTGKIMDDSGMEGTHAAVATTAELSRGLMKATGLMPWTDWGKLLAASYTQNDIAQKMLGYSKLSPRSRKQLADLGIGKRTAEAFQKEVGLNHEGIVRLKKDTTGYEATGYVFDYTKWENQKLAQTVQNTLFRESERNIVSPAVGEIPRLTTNDEVNKMIFQFQSFLFGAAHSVTVNLGKRVRDRDPKGFQIMTQLVLGGMVSVGLREAAYGNIEELEGWTPQDWLLNSLDYSSATPLAMMAFNKMNLMTGNALTNSVGATTMSRYAHRPFMSLLGPSVGTAEDVLLSIQAGIGVPFGQDLTPADMRRLRRIVPWNNYQFFAVPFTKAEEAISENL
jgi:hypothetical protein